MSEPFIGEIRIFAFNFYPNDFWLPCLGQQVAIGQYQTLYTIIANHFLPLGAAPSEKTFYLPKLTDLAVVGTGQGPGLTNWTLGSTGGAATVTLQTAQIPSHSHDVNANFLTSTAQIPSALGANASTTSLLSRAEKEKSAGVYETVDLYNNAGPLNVTLNSPTIGVVGGGQAHENRQPLLPMTYAIAWAGVYPDAA